MTLVDEVGCWKRLPDQTTTWTGRGALFLDRDGVIVEEAGFLQAPSDVRLLPGAAETIASFNRAGIPVVVVTNQSGVGRGYFGWPEFESVEAEITRQLASADAHVDAVYACGYHHEGIAGFAVAEHPWRKPRPGMLLAARDDFGLDLRISWVVGDRARDLAAGQAAGLAGGVHVMTGHADDEERRSAAALAGPAFAVRSAPNIAAGTALEPLIGALQC